MHNTMVIEPLWPTGGSISSIMDRLSVATLLVQNIPNGLQKHMGYERAEGGSAGFILVRSLSVLSRFICVLSE